MSVQKVGFFNTGVYLDTQKCLISPRKLGLQRLGFFSEKNHASATAWERAGWGVRRSTRLAADKWKHQFQFIFQYQWISARSMALVSMFLCNQSYASHGRDFLLGATILNFNAPFLVAHARMFKQPKPLWSIVNEHCFIFSSSSYMGSQVCSPSWSPFQLSSVRFLLPQK